MTKRLGEIADIQAGYQFRGRVVPDPEGTPVIQMKDFDPVRGIEMRDAVRTRIESVPPACIARPGDVLFLARGQRLAAAMVGSDAAGAVVSGYFFILRAKKESIVPGYLAWYINQPAFQEQLRTVAKGTDTPLVAKGDIQNLIVELPPKKRQASIARLDELSRLERSLLEAIAVKRAALIRALTQAAVRSGPSSEGSRK